MEASGDSPQDSVSRFSAQSGWLLLHPGWVMRTRLAGKVIYVRCKSERTCLSLLYVVGQGAIAMGNSLEHLSKTLKHFKLTPSLTFMSHLFCSEAPSSGHARHQIIFSVHQERMTWLEQCRLGFSSSSPPGWASLQDTDQHSCISRSRKSESGEIRRTINPLIMAWVVMKVNARFPFLWGWCLNHFTQITKDMMVLATIGFGRRHPMDSTWVSQVPFPFLSTSRFCL